MRRILALMAACMCLLCSSCAAVQDIWLPEMELVTPYPEDSFAHHIVPRQGDAVYMAWEYRPMEYDVRPGLHAAAPMWLYLVMDAGQSVLKDLGEMGYESFRAQTYVEEAHANGCEVWATVVGFEPEATQALVRDDEAVARFAGELADYVKAWDLDGINLDFENMNPEDTDRFTAMVARCRQEMPDTTLSVCVTVPVGKNSQSWYQSYDRRALARHCDYIAVMAYDGHKEGQVAPVAGLDWVRMRQETLLCEVPSNRVLLGIPVHGVAFVQEPGAENAYDKRLTVSYPQLEHLLASDELVVGEERFRVAQWEKKGERDEVTGIAVYAFADEAGNTVTLMLEDETSLADKIALVEEYSLGGIAVWQKRGGADSWWDAMNETMKSLNSSAK